MNYCKYLSCYMYLNCYNHNHIVLLRDNYHKCYHYQLLYFFLNNLLDLNNKEFYEYNYSNEYNDYYLIKYNYLCNLCILIFPFE